jgi:imidazolonepropionase-like amidohydrolase
MQTLVKAGALVDVDREVLVNDVYVLIEKNRIAAWGHCSQIPTVVSGMSFLDFSDCYLLPGLINSHVHLCLPSGGKPFFYSQSDEMALLTAVRNMRIELESGVTTLRDCGDQNGVLFHLRQAIKKDILSGPRLLLCGPPLTQTGHHAHFLGGVADGSKGIQKAVRKRVEDGADFIKLIATGGSTPGTAPALASYDVSELSAAVETAHRYGRLVTAHCRGTPGIRNAIDAGVDHIEHACFEQLDGTLCFDPVLAEKMADAGMFVSPTIQLYRDARSHLEKKADTGPLTPDESDYLQRLPGVIDEKFRAVQGFIDAGVSCVAGNDAGLPLTGFGLLWQELDAMVCGGMTPFMAILSATRTAAEAMKISHITGSIQPGKRADLIAVKKNPTQDIGALANVSLVLMSGRVMKKPDGNEYP